MGCCNAAGVGTDRTKPWNLNLVATLNFREDCESSARGKRQARSAAKMMNWSRQMQLLVRVRYGPVQIAIAAEAGDL